MRQNNQCVKVYFSVDVRNTRSKACGGDVSSPYWKGATTVRKYYVCLKSSESKNHGCSFNDDY